MPAYAECGGLMYLSKSISWQNESHQMAGIIPGDINMHKRPQGRGYVQLQKNEAMLWSDNSSKSKKAAEAIIPAHEFHYASLDNLPENQLFGYNIKRGTGITGSNDGLQIYNLIAGFTHQRNSKNNPWVNHFVAFVRKCKNTNQHSEIIDE